MSNGTNSTKRLLQHGIMVPDLGVDTAGRVLKPKGHALINICQGVDHQALAAARPQRRDLLAGDWPADGVA